MAKFETDANAAMWLVNLVQVTESISWSNLEGNISLNRKSGTIMLISFFHYFHNRQVFVCLLRKEL